MYVRACSASCERGVVRRRVYCVGGDRELARVSQAGATSIVPPELFPSPARKAAGMLRVSQLGNAAVLLLFATPHATALSLSHAARTGVRAEPRCTRNHVHEARALCERCKRPHRVCLCAALPPVPVVTQTRVLILQHPVEAKKTVATVPLVELCLANCTVVRGMRFEPELREIQAAHISTSLCFASTHLAIHRAIHLRRHRPVPLLPTQVALDEGYRPLLLYPGPDAKPLEERTARTDSTVHEDDPEGAEPHKVLLILADGTWRQALTLTLTLKPKPKPNPNPSPKPKPKPKPKPNLARDEYTGDPGEGDARVEGGRRLS